MYIKALKEIKKAEDPGDGRLCCELYKKLPPRREFKDYYEVIDNPIDLQVWVAGGVGGSQHMVLSYRKVHCLMQYRRSMLQPLHSR